MRAAMMVWTWRMPARSGSPSWPSSSSLWSMAASSPSSRQVTRAGGALRPGPGFLRKPPLPLGQALGPAPQGHREVVVPAQLTRGPECGGPGPFLTPGLLLQVK